ncbi:MAG: ABC transporter permease [Acidobacteriota bacterium]|nr:ABC transporter permease [Acidobacteriota bacterium]
MLRSLIYFRRRHLAVAAGAAVACAVLTGALLVGDSVRTSLRDLALERLGDTQRALATDGFVRQDLAAELEESRGGEARVVPVLLLNGSAVAAGSRARASGVTLVGFDEGFPGLWPEAEPWPAEALDSGGLFPPVILNQPLQDQLGVEPGDAVLLSFGRAAEIPRGSLLGRREAGDVLQTLRLTVAAVIPASGPGAFGLTPRQTEPLNAFVPLARLQAAVDRPGRVNALLLAGNESSGDAAAGLAETLRERLTLEDLQLRTIARDGTVSVESERFVLRDETVTAIEQLAEEELAAEERLTAWRLHSYLANKVRVAGRDDGTLLPYAATAAFETPPAGFGELILTSGEAAPELGPAQALLNRWAAERLGAAAGDTLEIEYFRVGQGEQLYTETATLELVGVVEMEGLGADPTLTPEYPGISDADNIADWDPPFPVELDLVTTEDEAYWDEYRAAPKLFVSAATGEALWRSRYGSVTALRLGPVLDGSASEEPSDGPEAAGAETQDVGALESRLAEELPRRVDLGAFGLTFEPVRAQALTASQGATDFSQLFLAFSWFLILAAALLVALLFGLGVEQRAREIGLLRAVGFAEGAVRRRFLGEGTVVALVGCAVGLAGAVGYSALLMLGLRTLWLPAVGSQRLFLHVAPASLITGFVISLVLVVATILLTLRRLRRVSPPALLAGSVEPATSRRRGRAARWLAGLGGALTVGLLALALLGDEIPSEALFFGVGAGVLITGLALFSLWCRATGSTALSFGAGGSGTGGSGTGGFGRGGFGGGGWALLAVRNSARSPGRSVLSVTLVACACFVIVTAAANRRDPAAIDHGKESGTGGYALVARSDVPLFQNPGDPEARFDLGLPDDEALWEGVEIMALRRLPGDDASCLNLYRPERPQVLGVPEAFIERGGFHFHALEGGEAVEAPSANPWSILQQDLGTDPETGAAVIPAVADFESATWILKKKLGDVIELPGGRGEPVHLKLVGLLDASIFQSEMLISEDALLEHFPGVEGYTDFLVEGPEGASDEEIRELATALEAGLTDFGFDAVETGQRLAAFKAVQNTYISTFQTLGGLGLLLGTLGLAVVLLRNVHERRGELAALRAFGFRRSLLKNLILFETVFLLLLGIALGTVAALVSTFPYLAGGSGAAIPWGSLTLTLLAVFLTGAVACALATRQALRGKLLEGLKGE